MRTLIESEFVDRTSSAPRATPAVAVEQLWSAVARFASWLDRSGYLSYDPYDVWGTAYGTLARRLYYRKHPLGLMMTAPLLVMEMLWPRMPRLFLKKDRYATADAQLVLAFLNLYKASEKKRDVAAASQWLEKARLLADDLLRESISGYHGYGWGYPFDWQSVSGLIPKGTPHITATPYAYEAFTSLFDLTGDAEYLRVARSITDFVFHDLKDTPTGSDSAASSYTPNDASKVVNASAYRAFVLFDAAERFGDDALRAKAWKNLRFILQSQREDGAWLYAIDDPKQSFIDHFHTCFNLKNLHKINRYLQSADVEKAIRRGYQWYRKNLFDAHDNPRTYAIAPRLEIVRLEMYNLAEAITLGVVLRDGIPQAFALAQTLANRLMREYQLPSGHWITRVYRGGRRHTFPFLRWPQSQLFLALTNLLVARS